MIGSFTARMLLFVAALLVGDIPVLAASQVSPPSRRESMNALRELTRQLTSEAQDAQTRGYLQHTSANIASRTDTRIGEAELQKAITERQHRDPFIDAYIRWQLTSFNLILPEMNHQQFVRFMEQTPAMVHNPRASSQIVSIFERVHDAGPLSPNDLAQLREMNRELDQQTQVAESLNAPAMEFRAWVTGQLGPSPGNGPRPLLWMLENCVATVNAGRAPANIKRQISQAFSASATDSSLTDDDRRMIVQQVQRLAAVQEQRFVNTVTILADGSVRVTFSTAAITTRDVNNWISRLAGK